MQLFAGLLVLLLLLVVTNVTEALEEVEKLYGETLYSWNEEGEIVEAPTTELLRGVDVIGVYFSASWCGPCVQFTPQLAQFYIEMKKKHKKFEIIWVSRDRNTEEFVNYYQKMPWLAVTVENIPSAVERLGAMYKMNGIPHFVIVDADDGAVITLDGRTAVMKDKYGLEFPWRSRTLLNLLPKGARKAISNELNKVKAKLHNVLKGVLEAMAPQRVLNFILKKINDFIVASQDKVTQAA